MTCYLLWGNEWRRGLDRVGGLQYDNKEDGK